MAIRLNKFVSILALSSALFSLSLTLLYFLKWGRADSAELWFLVIVVSTAALFIALANRTFVHSFIVFLIILMINVVNWTTYWIVM